MADRLEDITSIVSKLKALDSSGMLRVEVCDPLILSFQFNYEVMVRERQVWGYLN